MGVPKFYRWISERYPNISRMINDIQIPDFDNFYLDMNGIIHACSHINEDNCETNVSEEEIFRNIFHYIDFLFRMIKPRKVFVMAVDGVAPRAKMNQQRSRRFRAGRDRIKKLKILAEKTGVSTETMIANHFDTNGITPGTTFMANLNEQLKYFINVKITTDPLWEGVEIHLSGHLTPGEGEHKIMEYIRYSRSQPGYDMNTRHCLYGLDADLMMLGLVTHEMHFALLREEVKYGPKKISKIPAPEDITWHLLQLPLLRDYIDLEFRSIKEQLKFPYDLESIVDDWILMGYLIGNDFIPHLPHVHINQEALPLLWETYKKVLPTLDGYMNESGELILSRFEIYLTELAKFDVERFEEENDNLKHFDKLKSRKGPLRRAPIGGDGGFNLDVLDKLTLIDGGKKESSSNGKEESDANGQMIDRYIADERKSSSSSSSDAPAFPDPDDDGPASEYETQSDRSDGGDDERKSRRRKKKNSLLIPPPITNLKINNNDDDDDDTPLIAAEFRQHKNNYYRDKMKVDVITPELLRLFVEQYIEALQWILKYYYQGCPSWSWFYPHHYAPYLSDLTDFKNLKITLQQGTPFKPFEQLLGVLPPTSRYLLPTALQTLMIDPESPLLHFYPEEFALDQNEKKQDWEAIVLLPFIDEQLLLNSITKSYPNLSIEEQARNIHSSSLCYKSTSQLHPINNLLSTNPYFPPLKETSASCMEFPIDFYRPNGLKFKTDRFQNNQMILFPKFPALNVLPYKFAFKKGVVDLFDARSKATTLVLNLTHRPDDDLITYNEDFKSQKDNMGSEKVPFVIHNRQTLIERYIGKRVFVNWPHFEYGIVCAVCDFKHWYMWTNMPGGPCFNFRVSSNDDQNNIQDHRNLTQTPIYVTRLPFEMSMEDTNNTTTMPTYRSHALDPMQQQSEYTKAMNLNRRYETRQGVTIGPIPILIYVCPLIGYRTKCSSTSDKCTMTMCFSNQALAYPIQTTLFNLPNYKFDLYNFPQTINDYFKPNDYIFGLNPPYYSCLGQVQQINLNNNGKYMIGCRMEASDISNQPDIHQATTRLEQHRLRYWTAQDVAGYLGTTPSVISKISGIIFVTSGTGRRENTSRINVGLAWKANKPVKQLQGYTKKEEQVWLYSDAAVKIIFNYMEKFPEIVLALVRKPKDESYPETLIWPEKRGKSRVQEVRSWIKSLPTYSMSLIDGSWEVLDAPVVREIDKIVKSFYSKRSSKTLGDKSKILSIEPNRLFKSSESLGMCDPDVETCFYPYDRVVNVRLGTGVPIGTRGTVIGIMRGHTHLETYYEILFDHLPKGSLETILFGGNQQCRIKVRSYHLLNYSHSLRIRSIPNDQQQRTMIADNVWERRLLEQQPHQSAFRQPPPTRILQRGASDNGQTAAPANKIALPPSAPVNREKPNFVEIAFVPATKEQPTDTNGKHAPLISPVIIEKSPEPTAPTSANVALPVINELSTAPMIFPQDARLNTLFMRAIRDSPQMLHLQQQQNTAPPVPQQQQPPIFQQQQPLVAQQQPSVAQQPPSVPQQQPPRVQQQQQQQPSVPQQQKSILQQQQPPTPRQHQPLQPTAMDFVPVSPPVLQQYPTSHFAEAIESMHRNPPPTSPSMHPTGQQIYSPTAPQVPMSFLQRAIQQSEQINPMHAVPQQVLPVPNGHYGDTPFQPFDLPPPGTLPGFQIGPLFNPMTFQPPQIDPRFAPPSPLAPVSMGSPYINHVPHQLPPQQVQPPTPPRMPARSTLQFVPSQVLRNMPKHNK